MTGGGPQDCGVQDSINGIQLFVQEWNTGNRKQIECPNAPKPAVVEIPRAGGGKVRVWVKAKELESKDSGVYLTPSGTIDGDFDFLTVVRFTDVEQSRADFYIMTREEVETSRKKEWLQARNFCGQESWEKLENAVQS